MRKDQLKGLNFHDPAGINRTHLADELKRFSKETVQRQELYDIYQTKANFKTKLLHAYFTSSIRLCRSAFSEGLSLTNFPQPH